jgi:hypothetical protein
VAEIGLQVLPEKENAGSAVHPTKSATEDKRMLIARNMQRAASKCHQLTRGLAFHRALRMARPLEHARQDSI